MMTYKEIQEILDMADEFVRVHKRKIGTATKYRDIIKMLLSIINALRKPSDDTPCEKEENGDKKAMQEYLKKTRTYK